MVPGWSERERQGLQAMRHDWLHANRRDGLEPGVRAGPSRVGKICTSLAASATKVVWWFGRHGLQLASLTTQICALRTFWLLDQISRGGIP